MQHAVFLHVRHDRRAGLGIEIARQDHRPIPAQRFDALPEQVHAFVAGDLPYMVEVGVDEEELPSHFPVMQYDPGCHALAGAVPPFRACDVGGFAQPESPGFEGRKTIPPVKYGTELARLGTVLTADAHRSIAGQQTLQVAELVGKQLLRAENVDAVRSDHLGDPPAAETPVVRPVFGVVVTHVEGHDAERRGRTAGSERRCRQKIEQSFHNFYLKSAGQSGNSTYKRSAGICSKPAAPGALQPQERSCPS